jgi:hypothetical protein
VPVELSSWKEIAGYLGVTARTAQMWERERGLPVRRLPGPRGRVYAVVEELERWKSNSSNPAEAPPHGPAPAGPAASPPGRRRLIPAAIALAAAVIVLALTAFRHGQPAQFKIEDTSFVVMDSNGHELWRKRFIRPESLDLGAYKSRVAIADLDGDGRNEVLFAPPPDQSATGTLPLICYAEDGSELWRFTPGRAVRTAKEVFEPPYSIVAIATGRFGAGSGRRILVLANHDLYFPCQTALLSSDGRLLREYWHSGQLNWLFPVDINRDGRDEVVLAGTDNAALQTTIVALDPATMDGASVESNPAFQLLGMKPGVELRRILIPRSCINIAARQFPNPIWARLTGDEIIVNLEQSRRPSPDTASLFFHFNHDLRLRDIGLGSDFQALHEKMYRSGQLDHPFSDAELDRLRNEVRDIARH